MDPSGQQGHQIFHCVLPTFIPDWVPSGLFEDLRGVIQGGIQRVVTLDAFVTQGYAAAQTVAVKGLSFPVVAAVDVIPYAHYNVEWDVDVVTDVDWVPTNTVITILVVGGIAAVIASFFIGGPIAALLVGAGIFLFIAAGLLAVTETVHEVLGGGINPVDIWKFVTSPIGLIIIGIGGGYFIWSASGRGLVSSGARRAAPYVRRGASAAARHVKRSGRGALEELSGAPQG